MKAKIKRIEKIAEFTNTFGTTFYHQLEMEGVNGAVGDKIEIGKKKKQEIGWELDYEITERGAQEYQKSKTPPKDVVPPTPVTGHFPQPFVKNDVQDDILYSVCLKGSMDFYLRQSEAGIEEKYGFNPTNICSMALEIAVQAKKDIASLKTK